jgi:hypothetical protein
MAILIFVLSFILLIAAAASGYQSLDLLPTSIGVLYALAGVVAVCAAVVAFAIGVMIRRIDALARLLKELGPRAGLEFTAARETLPSEEIFAASPSNKAPLMSAAIAAEPADEGRAGEDESPININRAGHLPSLEAVEAVLETPEPQGPPSLIGSYSSAGANYKIFSDGSIEAETNEGTFKFSSMSDFKRHLIDSRGRQAGEEKSGVSTR